MEWKQDVISKGTYNIKVGKYKLSVHGHIYYPKGEWLFSCRDFNIIRYELKTNNLELAKSKALHLFESILKSTRVDILRALSILEHNSFKK